MARATPFYAARLDGHAEPVDEASWRALPMLTRQDLFDNTYPRSTAMLSRAVEGMMVISTGGSSGGRPLYGDDLRGVGPLLRRAGCGAGAARRRADRPGWPTCSSRAACGPPSSACMRRSAGVGAVHLPISGNIPVEAILRFCREFDPTAILSLPTAFVFLADHALKDGLKFPSLRLVGYGGEQMSAEAEAHVRRGLGPRDVAALGYSSGDAGLMGYQCPHCPPGVYHLPTGFQYIEIIDR